jgi:hypothetical protein
VLDGVGGEVVLFSSIICSIGAGKLKNRNAYSMYNNNEEI